MLVEGLLRWARRGAPAICRLFAYFAAAATGGAVAYHALRGSDSVLGLFEDDFFYYAVIADHLATLGKLTFDGVTHTNGFHPLWFAIVFALRLLTGGIGSPFFALFGLILIAVTAATYEALRLLTERLGASPAVASVLSLLQMGIVSSLVATGMEVALALPLYAFLLAEVAKDVSLTPRRTAKLGLLAALVVLARLDLALAFALLVGSWLVWVRPWPERPARVALAFAGGAFPLFAYFAFNKIDFGAFLPTSARAKELGPRFHLTARFLGELLAMHGWKRLLLVLGACVVLVALARRDARRSPARVAAAVGLGFPIVFYLADGIQSDWYLFSWYSYPLVPAVVVASTLLLEYGRALFERPLVALGASAVCAAGAVLVPLRSGVYFVDQGPRWAKTDNTVAAMGFGLADRMRDSQGRFAMGDKAGIATFLLRKPVVQLEGLVSDAAMLQHIERRDSLNSVLKEYGVDYLVVAVAATRVARRNGCYVVVAPNPDQAGSAPEMSGELCEEPMVHFEVQHGPHPWSRCLPIEVFVFDVRQGNPRAHLSLERAIPQAIAAH